MEESENISTKITKQLRSEQNVEPNKFKFKFLTSCSFDFQQQDKQRSVKIYNNQVKFQCDLSYQISLNLKKFFQLMSNNEGTQILKTLKYQKNFLKLIQELNNDQSKILIIGITIDYYYNFFPLKLTTEKLLSLIQFLKQSIMQIDNNCDDKKKQSNDDEFNKAIVQKKKPLLFKKKKLQNNVKLFFNIAFKHVVNIGDVCFFNQDALRNPQATDETLLKSLYHYNFISKVTLNKSFVNIELKKNCDNFLPPEYFIERLRSFGDKRMAKMADNLEQINNQFSKIKQSTLVQDSTFSLQNQERMLKNFLASMEGKRYLLFFSEISSEKITMKNIFFSVPLLEALGCNIKNIGLEFLRYKHIFFEVFTAKNYGNFLEGCYENFQKIQAQMMENPDLPEEQRLNLSKMEYYDQVIRRKQGTDSQFEESVGARVMWGSPHPSICYFEILDIHETQISPITKKVKINQLQLSKPQEDLQFLKRLGNNFSMLMSQEENKENDTIQNVRLQVLSHSQIGQIQRLESSTTTVTTQTVIG